MVSSAAERENRISVSTDSAMAFAAFSWPFRRRGNGGGAGGSGASKSAATAAEDEELGVTPQLLDFLRTLSPDAFKAAALQLQGNQ